jgi:hypothetical protein
LENQQLDRRRVCIRVLINACPDAFALVPLSVEQGSPVKEPMYQKPLRAGESEVRIFDLNEDFADRKRNKGSVTMIWLVLLASCCI